MIYLLNFIAVLAYYLVIKSFCGQNANRWFCVAVTMHAILFRALANPFNYVDTEIYARAFDEISSYSFKEIISPDNVYIDWGMGYVLFNWLIGQLSGNFQTMYALLAVIGLLPVFMFFYKTSHSFILSVIIYLLYPLFFYMGLGVLRQHVAIGFVLMALLNIDKTKVSLLWAVLAVSFHTSACLFFPYYLWRYINKDVRNLWKSVFLILSVAVILRVSFGRILMYFDRYQSLYGGIESAERNIVPVIFMGSLLLLLWCTGAYKRLINANDKNIMNFLLYGFALSLVCIGTYGMGRVTLYFMYVLPVAITFLDGLHVDKILSISYKCAVFILIMYLLSGSYSEQPYAYSFYWEKIARAW